MCYCEQGALATMRGGRACTTRRGGVCYYRKEHLLLREGVCTNYHERECVPLWEERVLW